MRVRITALTLIGLLLAPVTSSAQESNWADGFSESRDYVRDEVFALADQVDDFFDNARSEEQKKSDYLRLGADVRFRASEPIRLRQRYKLGVNLDAISDRLRLIATGENNDRYDNGRTIEGAQEGDDFVQSSGRDNSQTGLRYSLIRDAQIELDVDGGVRFGPGPNPYGQIRASRRFPLDPKLVFEPSQFLLWEYEDGFGEKTRFDINREIDKVTLGRSRSEVLWSESSRGVDLYQEFSVFRNLAPSEYVGTLLSAVAYTEPGFAVDEYRLASRYRRWMGWKWLIGEVEPALAFPDDRSHKVTPEIIFRIDIYFDRKGEDTWR